MASTAVGASIPRAWKHQGSERIHYILVVGGRRTRLWTEPDSALGQHLDRAIRLASLSSIERVVVERYAQGHDGRQIADSIGEPVKTVNWHGFQALRKLGLSGKEHVPNYMQF